MANGTGGLLQRMNDIAAHGDAVAKWARTTPEQEWLELVRTEPAPKLPYGVPPYVYVKMGFGMEDKRFEQEVTTLYKRRTKAPEFADYLFRDFPPGLVAGDITFVGPDANMSLSVLAQRAVDVQIAAEEALDYPNNLTSEQRATLVDARNNSVAGARQVWVELPTSPPNIVLIEAKSGKPVLDEKKRPVSRRLSDELKTILVAPPQVYLGPAERDIYIAPKNGMKRLIKAEADRPKVQSPVDLQFEPEEARHLNLLDHNNLPESAQNFEPGSYSTKLFLAFFRPWVEQISSTLEGVEEVLNSSVAGHFDDLDTSLEELVRRTTLAPGVTIPQVARALLSRQGGPLGLELLTPAQLGNLLRVLQVIRDLEVQSDNITFQPNLNGQAIIRFRTSDRLDVRDKLAPDGRPLSQFKLVIDLRKRVEPITALSSAGKRLLDAYPLSEQEIDDWGLHTVRFIGLIVPTYMTAAIDVPVAILQSFGETDTKSGLFLALATKTSKARIVEKFMEAAKARSALKQGGEKLGFENILENPKVKNAVEIVEKLLGEALQQVSDASRESFIQGERDVEKAN